MLADKELEMAAGQLADFRAAGETHYATLTDVLQKYATLMDDYKRLRSDYEEERENREKYKQMARGAERNPFVLVLVDGDGYVFNDDLISQGVDGGQEAARLLNDEVKSSLRARGLEDCRIMVRVYANLAGLSKALNKAKLSGAEKRSLAPFAASFTRSNDLFDFVDAGELKENADFKIRAMFRLFADNAQCKHIFFAGCHDVGYISELTQHVGNRDRITLVRTPALHYEFTKLGLRIEDFGNIFRQVPLEAPSYNVSSKTISMPTTTASSAKYSDICKFYQNGLCQYGSACHFKHIKDNTNRASDEQDWRQARQSSKSATSPFEMHHLAKSDNDFMSGNNNGLNLEPVDFAATLPRAEEVPRGEVPVNKYQHRLDIYIPPPTMDDRAAFNSRINYMKLCNNHHLLGHCPAGPECEYDHSPVSPAMLNALNQKAHTMPCPRKGACRSINCLMGHICQNAECKHRGGKVFCKFPQQAHVLDMNTADYVRGTGMSVKYADMREDMSSEGSTPITEKMRHLRTQSDGWEDGEDTLHLSEQGARLSMADHDDYDSAGVASN